MINGFTVAEGEILGFDKKRRTRWIDAIMSVLASQRYSPSLERCALLFSKRQTISSTRVVRKGLERWKPIEVNKVKITSSRYTCVWCIPVDPVPRRQRGMH